MLHPPLCSHINIENQEAENRCLPLPERIIFAIIARLMLSGFYLLSRVRSTAQLKVNYPIAVSIKLEQ